MCVCRAGAAILVDVLCNWTSRLAGSVGARGYPCCHVCAAAPLLNCDVNAFIGLYRRRRDSKRWGCQCLWTHEIYGEGEAAPNRRRGAATR